MTNITKEEIENKILKFLNNGGDRKVLKQRINGIGSEEFSREFKEFVNLNNPTHTTNNTRKSSPGVTVNVYNSNSSVLDNPFFGYGSVAALLIAIIVTVIAPDVLVIFLVVEMVMAKDVAYL